MHGHGGVEVLNALAGLTARNAHPWQIGQYFLEDAQIDGEWVHYVDTYADLDRAFARIAAARPDMLKVFLSYSEDFDQLRADGTIPSWYRGLDPALIPSIVERGHAMGLRVAAHVMSAHDFDVAVESGVDVVAHLPGFAPGAAFTPEESTPWLQALLDQPQRYLISDAMARTAARQGVAVMTTVSGVEEPPSPAPAWWSSYVEFQARVTNANLDTLRNAGVILLVGSDRYDFSSVDEARYLVRGDFMSPVEALRSLSYDTPRWLFPGRNIGSLTIGAEATFVVIAEDPLLQFEAIRTPTLVVKAGNVLRPQ
jgi:imidazolonepropionase-like amidohydrolase